MRLLVNSYFPVLADLQLGGAQLIMRELLLGFAQAGLEVTVLCPESDRTDLLRLNSNLRVLPKLKQVANRPLFPYERTHNWRQVAVHAEQADVIWTLDDALPLQLPRPVVLTLDQFSYREEMESLLSLTWDVLIVSSRYLWEIAQAIVGPKFWEGEPPAIELIPYAIDTDFFSPVDPTDLRSRLGLSAAEPYLLFPHRPDPDKGFDVALKVLRALRDRRQDYKLLVPMNPAYKSDIRYYNSLRAKAEKMGIDSHLIFHRWVSLSDLPAYFSLAAWTLVLGSFPEGFGLTPVQSVSCGTPVISTRAGALGELFPPGHGVYYVPFHAVEEVVSNLEHRPLLQEMGRGRAFVKKIYSIERLVESHLKAFRAARKKTARYNPLAADASVRLSPWCHIVEDGVVWHDYRMRNYRLTPREWEIIRLSQDGGPPATLKGYKAQLSKLIARGIILGNPAALDE
jgi:glycosyltransferase involved in cell wall biosynthesis